MFRESISNEELKELPLRFFEGEIHLIDQYSDLVSAARYLESKRLLGFDTETKPAFKKGATNKVALLQLCAGNEAFLFRIRDVGLPPEIQKILSSPKIIKPGIAIRDDIKTLRAVSNFKPEGFVELQDMAKELGIQDFSLKKLTAIILGFRISKSQQLTNWEAEELTGAQMIYAATDAWTSLEIYRQMIRQLNTGNGTIKKNNP